MTWMRVGTVVKSMLLVGMVAVAQENPFEMAAKVAYSGIYEGKDNEGAAYTLVLCERGDSFDGSVSRAGNVMQIVAALDGTALAGEMKDANGASPIKVVVSGDVATFVAGSVKVELERREGPSFVNRFSSDRVKISLATGEDQTLAGSLKFQGRMYDVKARANGALCWGTFGGERSWRFTLQRESDTEVLFRTGTFAQSLQDENELERRAQEAARRRRVAEEVLAMQRRRNAQGRLTMQSPADKERQRKAEQQAAGVRQQALAGDARAQNDMGRRYESGDGVPQDPQEAVKWYLGAAQQGYALAQYNVALQYRYGQGVDRNDAEAAQWFRKAAEKGHAKAQLHVGHAYRYGRGVERNDAVAIRWYGQAAGQKEPRAEYAIGKLYEEGNGVERNYERALAWYRKAAAREYAEAEAKVLRHDEFVQALPLAKEGDAMAQSEVGDAYTHGDGVGQDYTKALEWYLKAADKQNASAEHGLGDAYYNGRGVARDRTEAARWYRKAAERGYATAQVSLGHACRRGTGVKKDYAKALEWYRKAAEQEDARGQHHVGRMYEEGYGVTRDHDQALIWFGRAAAGGYASAKRKMRERDSFLTAKAKAMGGNAAAQREFGTAHADGIGTGKDSREAVPWFRRAAEQGDAAAQYRLADCYCRGEGVERDDQEAAKWCKQAAEKGERQAQCLLGFLLHCGRGIARDDKQAVTWFQKSAAQGYSEALYELGACHEKGYGVAQNLDAAAIWYTKAMVSRKSDPDLTGWQNRARVWEEQGKLRQLATFLDALVKQSPNSPIVYRLRGLGHERQGRLDEALRDYTKAIELLPDYGEAHARRAAIWQNRGAGAKAIEAYTVALQRNPGWAAGYIQRGLAWARAGDMDKAQVDCARAIGLDPEDSRVLNRLAWTYLTQPSLKNPADALILARKAAALTTGEQDRSSVLDTLACAYAANGRFDDAVRTQREAIANVTSDLSSLVGLQEHLQAFEKGREPANLSSFEGLKPPAW